MARADVAELIRCIRAAETAPLLALLRTDNMFPAKALGPADDTGNAGFLDLAIGQARVQNTIGTRTTP